MDGSESQNHSGLMCAKWFVSARPFDVVGSPAPPHCLSYIIHITLQRNSQSLCAQELSDGHLSHKVPEAVRTDGRELCCGVCTRLILSLSP